MTKRTLPPKYQEYLNKNKRGSLVKKTVDSPKKGIAKINGIFLVLTMIIILASSGIFAPVSILETDREAFEDFNAGRGTTSLIPVTIYSSTTCGCCHEYVEYLSDLGFEVNYLKDDVKYLEIKDELSIPVDQRSCHTTIIQGSFSEGHVPASTLYDLINEQPDIDGIALAGMPAGSPGMSGEKSEDWDIYSILNGVAVEIFKTIK
jgi:hypothetical protein